MWWQRKSENWGLGEANLELQGVIAAPGAALLVLHSCCIGSEPTGVVLAINKFLPKAKTNNHDDDNYNKIAI